MRLPTAAEADPAAEAVADHFNLCKEEITNGN